MNPNAGFRGVLCLTALGCACSTSAQVTLGTSTGSAAASSASSATTGTVSTTNAGASSGTTTASATSGGTTGAMGTACEAIANFRATSSSAQTISLAWTGAPGITVTIASKSYCGTDGYVTLATLTAGTTSYTDSSVNPTWVYWYELTASDGHGNTAAIAIGAAAGTNEALGCSGGAAPQPSGVPAPSCGGNTSATGATTGATAGTGTTGAAASSTSTTSTGTASGTSSASTGGATTAASATSMGATSATTSGGTTSSGGTTTGGVTLAPAFYVATNGDDHAAGTLTAPFATLGQAQTAMQGSSTIKTTYVRAGSYVLPTLDCGSGSSCGLNLTGADDGETWSYYPPDGVDSADFSGGSTSASTGLTVAINIGSSNVTINGLSIHDFSYAGIGSSGGADQLLIENNLLFNGYEQTNNANPGAISFYGAANTTISHNVIHDIAMFGVTVSNVNGNISNLLVTGNVIYNTCTANADCGALYVQDTTTTATNLQLTNNYIHDGNTFAGLGSNYGAGIYADDCTSNVTETGNVLTGHNGSNTFMIHGGSNIHQTGNLTDLGTYAQHVAVYQTSGVSACSSALMNGNIYENNLVIGAGGGGGFALLSGSPKNVPLIENNDYFSYGAAISSGSGSYADSNPLNQDPQLSGWTYSMDAGSAVLGAPVSFPPLVGAWGPPGYVLPETGSPPSCPY